MNIIMKITKFPCFRGQTNCFHTTRQMKTAFLTHRAVITYSLEHIYFSCLGTELAG